MGLIIQKVGRESLRFHRAEDLRFGELQIEGVATFVDHVFGSVAFGIGRNNVCRVDQAFDGALTCFACGHLAHFVGTA